MNICLRINVMIVFQVSVNLNLVKEILKTRCQVYILMKKVIILGKIPVIIKSFAPPFISHFRLNLNRKKRVVMRRIRRKLNIFTFELPIYYILEKEISIVANVRSNRPDVFCKKDVLKNFTKCTGIRLFQSLFCYEVSSLGYATLLKKILWHSCFPVNFAKFLRTRLF